MVKPQHQHPVGDVSPAQPQPQLPALLTEVTSGFQNPWERPVLPWETRALEP